MSAVTKPLPEVTEELAPFFAAARRGKLVLSRCRGCGDRRLPPRPICSRCLGREHEWTESTGRGTVYSFNRMHQVYHPGFAGEVPYVVVLVELEDGGRIISNLRGSAEVKVGMPVEVAFEPWSDELTLPTFRPLPR